MTLRNTYYFGSLFLLLLLSIAGCKEGNELPNSAPETKISIEKIDRTGENRLNSSVYLAWFGTDVDGYVAYYEYSQNGTDWTKTENRDSIFKFSIEAGQDTADIPFYVRAIDDDGTPDPTPAFISVPLKNALPTVDFDLESMPEDTAFSVVTFRWNYNDPDGKETATKAWLKANDGNWIEIDKNKRMLSLRSVDAEKEGIGEADIFYDFEVNTSALTIDGFNNGGENILYLKVEDIAGAESLVDTSLVIFVKHQTSDLLLISGQPNTVNKKYTEILSQVYNGFDAVDFALDNGQYQPKFWNPTFSLLTQLYDKLVFNCDQALFSNTISGQSGLLLEFAAPVLQNFTNNGGKSLITTSFPAGFDPETIRGALPVDSLSTTSGQAVLNNDSMVIATENVYPDLGAKFLILGLDPFVPTVDAQPLYMAQYSTFGAWQGPSVVGVYRESGSNKNQFFFSVELHTFDDDETSVPTLFDQILNKDFNW